MGAESRRPVAATTGLVLGLLLTCVSCLALPTAAVAAGAGEGQAPFFSAGWEISVLSYRLAGTAFWVTGADGSVRLEIVQRTTATAGRDQLDCALDRYGDGWTLVLGDEAEGTFNRWHREWRRLPISLHLAVRAILGELYLSPTSGPAAALRPEHRPWMPRPPGSRDAVRRLELPPLHLDEDHKPETMPASAPSFRRRLAARGGGRGGSGEVMSLVWDRGTYAGQPAATVLEVRSTRRPGVLRIAPPFTVDQVTYLDPELFVPLWPLRDLIVSPGLK